MRLLLAMFWVIGCGGYDTAQSKPIVYYETEEFKVYAQKFEAYSALYSPSGPVVIYNLKIVFGDTKGGKSIGLCSLDLQHTSTIYINKPFWDKATPAQKEVLVFHELGHCVLGRDHNNQLNGLEAPTSIMYYDVRPAYYYPYHKPEFLTELFSVRNDWKQ